MLQSSPGAIPINHRVMRFDSALPEEVDSLARPIKRTRLPDRRRRQFHMAQERALSTDEGF